MHPTWSRQSRPVETLTARGAKEVQGSQAWLHQGSQGSTQQGLGPGIGPEVANLAILFAMPRIWWLLLKAETSLMGVIWLFQHSGTFGHRKTHAILRHQARSSSCFLLSVSCRPPPPRRGQAASYPQSQAILHRSHMFALPACNWRMNIVATCFILGEGWPGTRCWLLLAGP